MKYRTASDYFVYRWKWGDLSDPEGALIAPEGIAVNQGTGAVYLADAGRHLVYGFHANASFLGQWGNFGTGNEDFNTPARIVVDAQSNIYTGAIYVTGRYNHRIEKFDAQGNFVPKWGGSR